MTNPIRELDTVVLLRDIPEAGLHAGDLGAVVLVHPDAYEVEFVGRSGHTGALRTLPAHEVRVAREDDFATRPVG